MKSKWRTVKLGNICKINAESYSQRENWPFVNYLDTGNITKNRIDYVQHINIKAENLPSRAKRKVGKNSIIYSTVRPNQRHYILSRNEIVDSLHAIAEQSTSAYPAIKPSDLEDLEIVLPSLFEQQKIADILSSFDNKIELNTKINENLE